MKIPLMRIAVLALCAGLLPGAQRATVEYRIWAGAPPDVVNGPGDATYVFDDKWRQRSISSDEWILARQSTRYIRLRALPGRWWYSLDGKSGRLTHSECHGGAFDWIISPSGSFYACVDDYYPGTTLRVFRSRDRRLIATVTLPKAYIEGRNQIAFLDDDRVAFSDLDETCPRERRSKLPLSIDEISIGGHFRQRTFFRCASGIIVGTRRVAFLREFDTEYSVDTGGWVNQRMYAFDQDDNPITDDSPPIRAFTSSHPKLAVWLISVGLAPAGDDRTR